MHFKRIYDIAPNDTQHNGLNCDTRRNQQSAYYAECCVFIVKLVSLCIAEYQYAECHYAECRYAECRYAEQRNAERHMHFVLLN
jgi:hypothetical protein